MRDSTNSNGEWKALIVIGALYLPFLISLSMFTGHLQRLGDPSLFFSTSDAQGYKEMADYYTSLGHSERPGDFELGLRPFVFPLYLGLYRVLGIAGLEILQMVLNAASLWLVFLSIKSLSNRSWIAAFCTTLLALTPSFNFLVFHALTESLTVFLVCVFIALIVEHYKRPEQSRLFLAALVLSLLVCTRPIVLPFWIAFCAYYSIVWLREPKRSVWQPIFIIAPIVCQMTLTFMLTGSFSFSSSGPVAISDWYFPAVYGEKEYGKFIQRDSDEAREGMSQFPQLRDKAIYLIMNPKEAIKAYFYILVVHNLVAASNFIRPAGQPYEMNKRAVAYLQYWSIYLNRSFACIHAIMLTLMVWLIASGSRWYEQKAMLLCYLFAILLILPAGLAYHQGDRYMLVAEPLWLVAHSVLVGLFVDLVKTMTKLPLKRA